MRTDFGRDPWRGGCWGAGMHQICFDLKRGHLRTVWYGEQVMNTVVSQMTAARFDLLCLIRQKSIFRGEDPRSALTIGIKQREIWERLDLSKTTISRMLVQLEKWGWVRRERVPRPTDDEQPYEWRTRIVYLTELGLQKIAKAMRIMFRGRAFIDYFQRTIGKRYPDKHVVDALHQVRGDIAYVAETFGDRSEIIYAYGAKLAPGRWKMESHDHTFEPRQGLHPLYIEPPLPKRPPQPLAGAERIPDWRPFGYTPYENEIRDMIWGDERRNRALRRRQAQRLQRNQRRVRH